jgi:hemoglobin
MAKLQADLHELSCNRQELCGPLNAVQGVSSMKQRVPTVVAIAFTLALSACAKTDTPPPPASAPASDSSLYRRLGGYDALAAVTDAFLARINGDTAISVFFAGLEPPQLNRIRQMVVDQLCAATGGPCRYVGRSMKETHATLGITSEVFEKFMGHFQATLVTFSVPQREQDEVLAALRMLKNDVVTK